MTEIKSVFVEKFIGIASAGDHEFACYGDEDCDGVYIVQVGLVGVNVDLFDVLDDWVIDGLASDLYSQSTYTAGKAEYDRKFSQSFKGLHDL